MPILDAGDIAELKQITLDAFTQEGLTIGGDAWNSGAIDGYLEQRTPPNIGPAEPPDIGGASGWRFTLVSGTAAVRDVLTSDADTSIRIRLLDTVADPLFPVFIIERV